MISPLFPLRAIKFIKFCQSIHCVDYHYACTHLITDLFVRSLHAHGVAPAGRCAPRGVPMLTTDGLQYECGVK